MSDAREWSWADDKPSCELCGILISASVCQTRLPCGLRACVHCRNQTPEDLDSRLDRLEEAREDVTPDSPTDAVLLSRIDAHQTAIEHASGRGLKR